MAERLLLLPGWGLGPGPLQPLADALTGHLQVQIEPLPNPGQSQLQDWLAQLDRRLPGDVWLAGWSLGGMLASLLAARRQQRCRGLICLASNPVFVAQETWPEAMAADVFQTFRQAYLDNPGATLKRFASLCSHGSEDGRGLSRQLSALADGSDCLAGLDLLAELDTRAALQTFAGPQLHLFADADGLVPRTAATLLRDCLPHLQVRVLENTGHSFVLEQPLAVAQMILSFMEQ